MDILKNYSSFFSCIFRINFYKFSTVTGAISVLQNENLKIYLEDTGKIYLLKLEAAKMVLFGVLVAVAVTVEMVKVVE